MPLMRIEFTKMQGAGNDFVVLDESGQTGERTMKLLEPAHVLDGFVIDACIHSGGMAHIYTVHYQAITKPMCPTRVSLWP